MRIGIIAEGTTDQAVLENILTGLGYDDSDIIPIRPDLSIDETFFSSHTKALPTNVYIEVPAV